VQALEPERPPVQQLHLALFTSHEIQVWEQENARKDTRRGISAAARTPKRFWIADEGSASLFDALDIAVLDAPLGGPEEGNELNCDADPLSGSQEESAGYAPEPDGECAQPWSDDAVAQLHEAVLHHSLKALQAKGNGVEKREVLQWIFAPKPMIVALEGADGQPTEVALPQHLTPFSFERCCRMCGYSHERLMDGLMPIVRLMGLGTVFNEQPNGINTISDARTAEVQDPRGL
jgi:hypothetical protein